MEKKDQTLRKGDQIDELKSDIFFLDGSYRIGFQTENFKPLTENFHASLSGGSSHPSVQ